MYCLNAKAEKKRPAGNPYIGQESQSLSYHMSAFCQIEYVSSDSDVGTPCGKPAVSRRPAIRFERIIRVRGGEYDSNELIEVVVIVAVIIAAIRFFVKRA